VTEETAVGIERRDDWELRRQRFAEVLPAIGTELPIDGDPLDTRLVAHELAGRARFVLDFEEYPTAWTFLGNALVTDGTGAHLIDDRATTT
jgi:hypothetical protein